MADTMDETNIVKLRGRLSGEPASLELPSGDRITTFRIVVPRPASARGRATVDTINAVTSRAGVRRTIEACLAGDELELVGSLRRRFWRGAGGSESRYEVEVTGARRTARARPG